MFTHLQVLVLRVAGEGDVGEVSVPHQLLQSDARRHRELVPAQVELLRLHRHPAAEQLLAECPRLAALPENQ